MKVAVGARESRPLEKNSQLTNFGRRKGVIMIIIFDGRFGGLTNV